MKFLALIYLFISFSIFPQNELKGKYRMEYEEDFNIQNCIIHFENDAYKRKLPNGKTVKGKIEYLNQKIRLKDNETDLQMEFYKDEIRKDTIYFRTTHSKEVDKDNGDMIIYSGKLIRIK